MYEIVFTDEALADLKWFKELGNIRCSTLILQSADGTKFVLARVRDSLAFYVGDGDDFGTEIAATRKNRKLMKFLDKRGAKGKTRTGPPLAEVKRQLGL